MLLQSPPRRYLPGKCHHRLSERCTISLSAQESPPIPPMLPEEGAQKWTFLQLWDTHTPTHSEHLAVLKSSNLLHRSLQSWIAEFLVHADFILTDVSLDWNLLPSAGEAVVQVCDVGKATISLRWCCHFYKNLSAWCPDGLLFVRAPRENCWIPAGGFTNLNTARGESLSSWSCQWAGLIDQPIETSNSNSAFKDFQTWWSTPLVPDQTFYFIWCCFRQLHKSVSVY